ncbi:MAG: DUF4352 domain-containing protein [Clostridia bacterium]|nr:DUF4352 domain-containing protein [Clostridia bacterium]
MKLGLKAKRNIGLIAVTIAVVVAIILVVYFVQKSDDDGKLQTGAISQTVSTSQADICVKDMRVLQSVDGLTAEEGNCFLQVSVEIKANKKITVDSGKFEVKGGKNVTNANRHYDTSSGDEILEVIACEGETTLKKGESKTFNLLYEVEYNRVASYYLYAYGARIDLGGTVPAQA